MSSARLRFAPTRRWAIVAVLTTAVIVLYAAKSSLERVNPIQYPWANPFAFGPPASRCTPQAYASGYWKSNPGTNATVMTTPEDALAFSGFEGCASSREYFWHLAADKETQYDRFPGAQSYEWVPGEGCEDMIGKMNPEKLVQDLVEDGGWYLVGDSVTENHFFSLSCLLYPHVRATPNYTAGGSFDRGWPQNLYLSPSSPLVERIDFPKAFNITSTPLVTFRRIDLLLSTAELVSLHRDIQPPSSPPLDDDSLFSDESVWTLPLDSYVAEFLAPLPRANYATMVVSTGGHWTTTLLSKVSPPGMEGVMALFEAAMMSWATRLQDAIMEHSDLGERSPKWPRAIAPRKSRKRVVIRAYLPGHESCHDFRAPWTEVQPFVWNWYNWGDIWQFNDIFKRLLSGKHSPYPSIEYLGIDRPARLRPDAHTTGDCLHIMAGAGVLEGWTHYIWHFVTHRVVR